MPIRLLATAWLAATCCRGAEPVSPAPEDASPEGADAGDLVLSRSGYRERLEGFWLGQCIANWTGLRTEMVRKTAPFLTDADWGTDRGRRGERIEFVLVERPEPWGADDDTDIEYIYQHVLEANGVSVATPEMIRDGWLTHIRREEPNYLWVSNEAALRLMVGGMLPPETSLPANNKHFDQIDAQLTTEIFGLFAPGRPDVALRMAHLPIRTTAYREAEWIAEFYVVMHALAPRTDDAAPMSERVAWLADRARRRLPDESYPAKMYDFVKADLERGGRWEETRDRLFQRYQQAETDGYRSRRPVDAGINFGASLVSLFYGEGDFRRTVQIGSLCGWDSDNPTATWGGLIGFLIGREGVEAAFPDRDLSGTYRIGRTRINFPDRTPDRPGDDAFEKMARRGIGVVDRVVSEEMAGRVDLEADRWHIPIAGVSVEPVSR